MTRTEVLHELENLLGVPANTLQGNEELAGYASWDSMNLMTFIALISSKAGVVLDGARVATARTVDELAALVSPIPKE